MKEAVDLAKIGQGRSWHRLKSETQRVHPHAYVQAVAVCGVEGEQKAVARGLDTNVIRYEGANVCGRCSYVASIATLNANVAPVPTETKERQDMSKAKDTTKVSSREAIRLAFANGDVEAPATTAAICEAAQKYATSLGFNPRHQLEATLHAQARKDDGVVVRAGRGLFAARPVAADPEAAPVEDGGAVPTEADNAADTENGPSAADVAPDAPKAETPKRERQAKPHPKPAPRKRGKTAKAKTS